MGLFDFLKGSKKRSDSSQFNRQSDLSNSRVREYVFLDDMYKDGYFPDFLVDKCRTVLVNLCFDIELKKPDSLANLYLLTRAATERINDLQEEFEDNDSEIETTARDCLATDFEFVANAYGFEDIDVEELIVTREW